MSNNSIQSEQQNQRYCLEQQLGLQHISNWNGIQNQLGQELFQITQFSKQKKQTSQTHIEEIAPDCLQHPEKYINNKQENQIQNKKQKNDKQNQTDPTGDTFYEQSIVESNIDGTTIFKDNWRKQTSGSLFQFLNIAQKIYLPLIQQNRTIINKIKQMTKKTTSNINMYKHYFSIKLSQQKQRKQSIQNKYKYILDTTNDNQLLDNVYLDQKSILNQLSIEDQIKIQKIQSFINIIQECIDKLNIILTKAIQQRLKKINILQEQIERTLRIQKQLVNLMSQPAQIIKGHLRKDKYLQKKYLLQRQSVFLTLLKDTGRKTISLLSSIFCKQQSIIAEILAKQMNKYLNKIKNVYQSSLQQKIKISTSQLYTILPDQWSNCVKNKLNSQSIITSVSQNMENTIFLPSVTIDQDLIIFQAKARWMFKPLFQDSPSKKPASSSTASTTGLATQRQQQLTYNDLLSVRTSKTGPGLLVDVSVVLTADKFLHLQCADKVGTMRLKDLKLKKKGKTGVTVTQNKNMLGIFTSPTNLGQLFFGNEIDSELFINAVISTKR